MGATSLRLLKRLAVDDRGQDTLEYALLAALIAVLTIPTFNAIQDALKATYLSWNAAIMRCWQMPVPGTGGGC